MRIVIFTIALIFCGFAAHSQVLKSAGVWYFLDVDSLNNRPAQLPNGTELAYVIGTKKIYRWNRALSAWEEYSAGSSGLTMPFDSIYFTPSLVDPNTAELKYSADLETFVFGVDGTTIEIGQKTAWYVKNQSGATITKGTVVRAVGALGSSGRILIDKMVANGTVQSKYLLGIAASDIANGADGYVIHFGKLKQVNTNSWNEGDVLYASAATPGALTNVEPSPPNLRLPIAFVVNKSATTGVLAIRIQTGNELHELHDVDTTGIQNNGLLTWNSTSQKWQAAAPDNDKSATNEIQTLSFSSPNLTISGGNSVSLSGLVSGYPTGSGTTNLVPLWTGTSTLGISNFQDNGTAISILNSKPFQFGTWTTAGRPTGTTGYVGRNTTDNALEWYNGARWARAVESTFGAGTSTYIPYFDANGQLTQSSRVVYNGTQVVFTGSTNGFSTATKSFRVLSLDGQEMFFVNDNGQFGNAFFGVNYGGQVLTLGLGTSFPKLSVNGFGSSSVDIFQFQETGSFNIGGNATNIRIGNYSTWQSTRAFRINTKFEINGSTTAARPSGTSGMGVLYYNSDSTMLEVSLNNGTFSRLLTRGYSDTRYLARTDTAAMLATYISTGGYGTRESSKTLRVDTTVIPTLTFTNRFVKFSDTTSLLSKYASTAGWGLLKTSKTLRADSSVLATKTFTNRFVKFSDTTSLLANYPSTAGWGILKSTKTIRADSSVLATKTYTNRFLLKSDTAAMLSKYIERGDTATMLDPYTTTGEAMSLITSMVDGTYVKYADTASMLSNYMTFGDDTNLGNSDMYVTGDRTIFGNNHPIYFTDVSAVEILSGGVTPNVTVLSDAYFSMKQFYNLGKTKYFKKYNSVDTRPGTVSANPNWVDIFEHNFGGGVAYEWGDYVAYDTLYNAYEYKYGGQYSYGYLKFVATRSNNLSYKQSDPGFDFNMLGQEYSPDETAILGVRSGTDTIFNITNRGLLKPKKYGLGNFVADSTGRTESGFAVIVATDGTFIEKPISSFAGVTTNIYTDNGTLEEDRTITGAGHYLWATGLSSWIFSAQAVGSGWVNSNRVIGGVSSISSLKAGSTVQVAADSVSARIRYSVGGVERSIEIEQDTMFITPETMDSIAVGEVLTVTSIAGGRAAIKTRPVSTTDLHLGNSDLTLTGNRTLDGGGNSLTLDVSGFSVLSDGIWSSSFSGADYYLSLSEGISSVWTRDTNQTESISVEENLIGFDHRYFGMVGVFRMRNDSIWLSRIKAGTSSSEVSRIDMLDRAIKLKAIDASDAVNEIIIDSIAINFSKYGLGNMVKDSLSKTESDYLAGFATDGTVIELDRKTVPYHEITSTSSPQTFSSTKAVNFVNQGSTQTTFTFKMPANPVDGQELYIHWGNVVSTVTLDGNGKTIKGTAVTTATEGSERAFRFFSGCDCWLKRY